MTIPDNITRAHIEKAIGDFNKIRKPDNNRISKKYKLVFKGREYHPKYIISLANRYANNKVLSPGSFSGGIETNSYLEKRGFIIVERKQLEVVYTQTSNAPTHPFARIIICEKWDGEVEKAKEYLELVLDNWPKKNKVDFLLTCGGFLTFEWPEKKIEVLKIFTEKAEKQCKKLISEKLRKRLSKVASFITIGMDSYKDDKEWSWRKPHIELVCLINLKDGSYHFTGKSLPLSAQVNNLIRYSDYKSHFIKSSIGNIMILGCHDLNIFSPRSEANTKSLWKKKMRREFYGLYKTNEPKYVLQHPHTTDNTRTWCHGWAKLKEICPSIKFASAGKYYRSKGEPRSNRTKILEHTQLGGCIDFIFK